MEEGIRRQAADMLRRSAAAASLLPPPGINDCVTIPIPEVDRTGKTAVSNLIGMVVGIREEDGLYEIATEHGRVNSLLSRNQFEMSRRRDIIDEVNVSESKSIREMTKSTAVIKCHCYSNYCQNKRCLCRRKGMLCTDKCLHGRNSKTGKIDEEVARTFVCKNK